MLNPTGIVIEALIGELLRKYREMFGAHDADLHFLASSARTALETIAVTDAPYHDLHHTLMVTMVGQEILTGKHHMEGSVTPDDWVHFVTGLLNHDIGYVRGICRADRSGRYAINDRMETVTPPPGATDACLTPYHVDRAQVYVRERYAKVPRIDVAALCQLIERTRFPVPDAADRRESADLPGLLRAADLIGQLADPGYMGKTAALYAEFQETGQAERLGYSSAADVRAAYPQFFWTAVSPYIAEGIRFLRRTQEGQTWVAHLYSNVFTEEHSAPAFGPERRLRPTRRVSSDGPFKSRVISQEDKRIGTRRASDRPADAD
jgi:hypothetical protein